MTDVTDYVYEEAATRILEWLHKAEAALVDHAVVTFNGEAGTVVEIKLDEHHGLCFTIDPDRGTGSIRERRWYPVATIKHKEVGS